MSSRRNIGVLGAAAAVLFLLAAVPGCPGGSSGSKGKKGKNRLFIVESITPADGAVDVSVHGVVKVDFSQIVDPATVLNGSTFSVAEQSSPGSPVAGAFVFNEVDRFLSFLPASPLQYGASYVVTLTEAVKDRNGTPLYPDRSLVPVPSAFTTTAAPDTTPPSFAGAQGAVGLSNSTIDVTWNAAADDIDPQSAIIYNVYASRLSAGQNFNSPTATSPAGATNLVIGGLDPAATYYFVVRAEDTSGNEDGNLVEVSGATLAGPDVTPPTFAGASGAAAVDSMSIQVDWMAATDNVDPSGSIVYNIYMAQTPSGQTFATPTATTLPGALSEVVGGLQPSTAYYFVVRAMDTAGNEDTNLVEVSATTTAGPDVTPPIFGGATSATALDASRIQVGWSAAIDNRDPAGSIIYNIYMATSSGTQNFATPDVTTTAGALSEIVTGLAASTTYYFVVRAEDTTGNEDTNIVEVSATTQSGADVNPPVFGGATSASALSDVAIQVNWNPAVDDQTAQGAIIYNLYVATASGTQNFATPDVTSAPGATTESVTGLSPSTTYYVVVRAEDQAGNEDGNLVEVSATTTAGPDVTAPTFAGATSATALNNTSIRVNWVAASDDRDLPAQIVYNIYYATSSGGQNFGTPDLTTAPGVTSQVVGGLSAATTYWFVVRAEDRAGNEDGNLVEVSDTTQANPDVNPPTFAGATGATTLSDTQIRVDWNDASDDVSAPANIIYNLYMATSSGNQNFAVPDATTAAGANTHTFGSLTADTTYYFVVRAQDEAGNEDTNIVEVFATTDPAPDITAPTFGGATSALDLDDTRIQVSWTQAIDDQDPQAAIVYNLYVATSSGGQSFGTPTETSAAGVSNHTLTGLNPSTTYWIVVRAEDTSGNEDTNLVEVSATTQSGADISPPVFAGASSATALSPTSIQVSWTEAIDDQDPQASIIYNLYVATASGTQNFATPDDTSPPGVASHVLTGLLPNTTYYIVVRAEDTSGNEDTNTTEVSDTTPNGDIDPPVFGGVVSATAISPTEVQLTWTEATDDTDPQSAIIYNIYLATTPAGQNFATPDDVSAPGVATHTVTSLADGTTYYFVVRAEDTSGNEDSNVIEASDTTYVSFAITVGPLLSAECGGCHKGNGSDFDMRNYAGISSTCINMVSGCNSLDLIEPFDDVLSYIMRRMDDTSPCGGASMPKGSPILPQANRDAVRAWINQGALNN